MTAPRNGRSAPHGFTLIELMMVVAIIGVVSSIAIPTFQQMTLKAKAAERPELILRIKKAVDDLYLQEGRVELVADFQPALPLTPGRRNPDWKASEWPKLFKTGEEVLGALYYSYRVEAWEQDGETPAGFELRAFGDLDGDGIPSEVVIVFERRGGVYQQVSPSYDAVTAALDSYPY